ncbi:MAG TPA: lipid-A-disaccharide synthase [Bdellovibrionota bacterium]|nr:lipid-A-disaccharide synthase [Bdellovibrionota bacterium]
MVKILISAAETSSDVHGAELLKALREAAHAAGQEIEASGIGGPQLREAGLRVVVDAKELLAMGFSEVLVHLPKILGALNKISRVAREERPDLAVVIDYPDFHFRLARRLRKLGVPVVYYIPPKVWVWRKKRVRLLRELFTRVLCIFPFEEAFFKGEGLDVKYVGNPLLDELPLNVSRSEARAELGLSTDDSVLVLMPGSRSSELDQHLELMLDAALEAAERLHNSGFLREGTALKVLLPFALTTDYAKILQRIESWKASRTPPTFFQLFPAQGNSARSLIAADAGLIKSGTSTLEAALLGCPHAVIYKAGQVTTWIFELFIRYRGPVGLVNLVARKAKGDSPLVREILLDEVTVRSLADEAVRLLSDDEVRSRMREGFKELRKRLESTDGKSPSRAAAVELLNLAIQRPIRPIQGSWFVRSGSFLWSGVSRLVQLGVRSGLLKPARLPCRVVSVGNIQVGGAGKTPIVAQIAREAGDRGLNVCILSRGYRGEWERTGGVIRPGEDFASATKCGDEAALLHELVPHAWIGVGADRERQFKAVEIQSERPIDLVILDDGFQHWRLHKDLEIIAVTSASRREVLFREPENAIRRANLVLWTKGDREPTAWHSALRLSIPFLKSRFELSVPPPAGSLWLVSGIAENFGSSRSELEASVSRAGLSVARHLKFEDHARYDYAQARSILDEAFRAGCKVAITGKDWVKWRELGIKRSELIVLEPRLVLNEEGQKLWNRILWEN